MSILIWIFITALYVLVNLSVTKKITAAVYLNEDRRNLHKKIIWIIPFLGAWMLRAYWKTKQKKQLTTTTKQNRKLEKGGSFTESGAGMYPIE